MPAPRKVSIDLEGGKKHEFEIPAEYIHQDDLKETHTPKDQFKVELDRRVASVTKDLKKPEDLLADGEFVKRVATERKDDVLKHLGIDPKSGPMDVTKIQTDVTERLTREKIAPLEAQFTAASTEIGLLRQRDLDSQTSISGKGLGIEDDNLELVKLYIRERAAWDQERKQWFIKKLDGTEGFEFSSDPKKGGYPYMTVREYLEDIKQKGERKGWFTSTVQEGADYKGGGGDPNAMTLEQFQKLSPTQKTEFYQKHQALYMKFMEQIRQAGEAKLFAGR